MKIPRAGVFGYFDNLGTLDEMHPDDYSEI
jgi:hypothetical protein